MKFIFFKLKAFNFSKAINISVVPNVEETSRINKLSIYFKHIA